jgi:hypothetical protein
MRLVMVENYIISLAYIRRFKADSVTMDGYYVFVGPYLSYFCL